MFIVKLVVVSLGYVYFKKNIKFRWMAKEREAFETLKQKLTSQPVLILLDISKPFEVNCDACGNCLGGVLLQEGHAIA